MGLTFSRFAAGMLLKIATNSIAKNFYYILSCKIFKLEYLNNLQESDFEGAVRKKSEWANLVLDFSTDNDEKLAVGHYCSVLSKFGYFDAQKHSDSVCKELQNVRKKSEDTFYLYGPNSKSPPNSNYKDCTLVVTKDIEENCHGFRRSILFLNHVYYRTKIANDKGFKSKLLNKYDKIYISSILPIPDKEFEHSDMLPCSELGGSMALGRVLYNLIIKNGRFNCVVEGYDQYLSVDTYSKYYPTLMREESTVDERKVVQSLADHDALYNFLIVKLLLKHINLIDSRDFYTTVNISGDQYLKELASVRDFSLLK